MKIIDIHTHSGAFPHSKKSKAKYDHLGENMKDFNADLDKDNVSHCFITSVTALLDEVSKGNATTFSDAETDPRLYACAYYDPHHTEQSIMEIEKYLSNPKFVGIKSRPAMENVPFSDRTYRMLAEVSVKIDKPLFIHCGPPADAIAIAETAYETKAKIVMVHACFAKYIEAATAVKKVENVFIEPVSSAYYPGKIRAILNIIGHERLMFGSDYGLLSRARVIKTYEEAKLTDVEYEAIFRTNAMRIFGIKE
jgi:predicted TIM-barrel fold metal-dependent hydrolase